MSSGLNQETTGPGLSDGEVPALGEVRSRKSRLTLVPCDAEPRHWKVYGYWRAGYDYEPPCMYCAYEQTRTVYDDLRHAHHWPWRRWKLTHRLVTWMYSMGITRGGWSTEFSRTCKGCMTNWPKFGWGPRSYILGVRRMGADSERPRLASGRAQRMA